MTTANEPETLDNTPEKLPASASVPAPAAPDAAALTAQLAAAKKEAAESYDRYLRATADLENYRKRALREKDELRQFALTGVLQDLIAVLDNLQLGLDHARQQAEAAKVAEGVGLILEQLRAVLAKHGLTEINPAGQAFDPNQHEAISHQPSAEVPDEHVMQVARIGYALNGRLLRPASVIVSSGPAPGEAKP